MDEYIDREEVNRISFTDAVLIGGEVRIEKIALVRDIEKLLAADVVPVRHGRWIHTDMAGHWSGKDECSECNYHETNRIDLSHFNYCPNCGAKMDGGASDEI